MIATLSDAFRKTLAADYVKTRMVQQSADPAFLDSAQFTQFLQSEGARWGDAVKKAGVKLDKAEILTYSRAAPAIKAGLRCRFTLTANGGGKCALAWRTRGQIRFPARRCLLRLRRDLSQRLLE